MTDVVDPATRSRMMAGIRGRDTKPELIIRRGLHGLGFRYRLHVRGLSGRPDLVLPRRNAVVFIHGCFWHGHECPLFRWPRSREEFWRNKIEGNRARDSRVLTDLYARGWRVAVVWECALRASPESALHRLASWLTSDQLRIEIGQ